MVSPWVQHFASCRGGLQCKSWSASPSRQLPQSFNEYSGPRLRLWWWWWWHKFIHFARRDKVPVYVFLLSVIKITDFPNRLLFVGKNAKSCQLSKRLQGAKGLNCTNKKTKQMINAKNKQNLPWQTIKYCWIVWFCPILSVPLTNTNQTSLKHTK